MTNKAIHLGIKKILKIGLLLSLPCAAYITVNYFDPDIINFTANHINQHQYEYLIFRWIVLISFVLCFPYIIAVLGKRKNASVQQIIYWKNEFWRVAIWLILLELLVSENLGGRLIHIIGDIL
jgi:hypothetical protein